jgi:peptidyl-prolyl cis-trans isomerase D
MLLDAMRRHSRSFIIYILFGIIIAVFVINFGPQSAGCAAAAGYAGKVEGQGITPQELGYAYTVAGIRSQQVDEPQMVMLRGRVLDQLLFRELLAEDALKLGFRIPEKEINDMLVKGRFLALGQARPLIRGDDGKFDYDLFSRYVRYQWGLTVKKFKLQQRRELLAEKFRTLFRSSIEVSEDEVKADFIQKNTQVKLDYVRFTLGAFRPQVEIDDAKVKAFIAANRDKVKKYFEDNKTAYQKLPKQARVAVVQVNGPEDDAAARAAAKKKAEQALRRLKAGEALSKVAATLSDDEESRAKGGVVGWRNEDSPGLWEKASKEVAKLKDGETSPIVEDKEGFTIVRVIGRRQGDLKLAQAQGEIAEEMLREEEAVKLAKKAALEFHKRAKAGEKLEEMFSSADDSEGDKEDEDKDKDAADKDTADKKADDTKEKKENAPYKLATTAAFPRGGRNLVPGIGISAKLMNDVFELKEGDLAPTVYDVDGNVYLVRVKERTNPDWGDWAKRKQDLTEEYQGRKYVQALTAYAFKRCEKAEINITQSYLVTRGYTPKKGAPPLPRYVPCSSLQPAELDLP